MRALMVIGVCLMLLGVSSCHKDIPTWNGKIWVGVPEHSAVERAQDADDPVVYANEERFRGMMCMSAKDFESFVQTYVLSCKEWGVKSKSMEPAYKVAQKALP